MVRASPTVHFTPVLRQLRWLPVKARIPHKTCMPLFKRHHLFHTMLFSLTSYRLTVLFFSMSSRECRHPPPQIPAFLSARRKVSCFLLLWSFCLELIAPVRQNCYNYRYFQVRPENLSLQPPRLGLALPV